MTGQSSKSHKTNSSQKSETDKVQAEKKNETQKQNRQTDSRELEHWGLKDGEQGRV